MKRKRNLLHELSTADLSDEQLAELLNAKPQADDDDQQDEWQPPTTYEAPQPKSDEQEE